MAADEPRILYDLDCGFCRWALAKVLLWDRRSRPVAIQDVEGERALEAAGVPESDRLASWHFVDENGAVSSGGDAFAPMLARMPGGRPFSALARAGRRPLGALYGLVARNRHAFGRRLSERAKLHATQTLRVRADETSLVQVADLDTTCAPVRSSHK
jgi:predicted DCC family thiol-disulfide oxidoreductase YuxK